MTIVHTYMLSGHVWTPDFIVDDMMMYLHLKEIMLHTLSEGAEAHATVMVW